jgi:L-lactate dehydrogenase complex protein LldF
MIGHPERAARFLADASHATWHDQAVWWLRQNRDAAARELPEWEALRTQAARIKAHTRARLVEYLEGFEREATGHGAVVHWARDAAELRSIVSELLEARGIERVVKSKSMLTEECALNPHLEARGIQVTDTDLGERIVQLRREPPSHIIVPAIHLRKEQVARLFREQLGVAEGVTDPEALVEAARRHLRARFLEAEAGITGVNFAVAETGGLVVVTNEGNADLGTCLPKLHIACMGLEKLIPHAGDLPVFLRLLARSATGQAISAYTSHFHGPREGGELHVVIVDDGRSRLLADAEQREALACIRCGACLNTCPVYRRSGGHSYDLPVAGPIGSILAPARDDRKHASLPFACSLCGSCSDVCPVRVPLHDQLLAWRGTLYDRGRLPRGRTAALRFAATLLAHPARYAAATRLAARAARALPPRWLRSLTRSWSRQRELPEIPRQRFRDWWERERG